MKPDGAPIIIKRKKVIAGGGHHGGAWKVAYADFVTAMMAFFLLMWLLNATTESQRKGIADYFAPTVPVSPISGGGDGVMQGDSVFAEDTLARDGVGGATVMNTREDGDDLSAQPGPGDDLAEEDSGLSALAEELQKRSGESEASDDLLSHIVTRVTDEGLIIDVFARKDRPLFESGSAVPTERMVNILRMIASVISLVKNKVAIDGHTDAQAFRTEFRDNWGLSTDRADAARRSLITSGLNEDRIARITGRAAREPVIAENPEDPRNRRVAITLLRNGTTR